MKDVFSSLYVEEYVCEAFDCITVSPHHEIGKAHIIIHCDLTAGHWGPGHAYNTKYNPLTYEELTEQLTND